MAYELANVTTPSTQSTNQVAPAMREELTVSSSPSLDMRYKQALAKMQGKADPALQSSDAVINESAAEVPPAEARESLPLSPQLAAFARKEQKFRQEQAKLKAEALALESERKELAELRTLKQKIAANDYSDIDKLVDYEKLVQHKLGKDPRMDELDSVRSEIAALKAAQEKDVSQRFEQAVSQRRQAVKTLIASNDEFASIKELNAEEAVVQHILDTWENDEIDLTPEEAAKEVEAALLEKASKWTALSKLKKNEPQAAAPKELPPLKSGMKTLTNNMASTGEPKRPTKPLHLMTDNERYAEAYRRAQEKQKERQGF